MQITNKRKDPLEKARRSQSTQRLTRRKKSTVIRTIDARPNLRLQAGDALRVFRVCQENFERINLTSADEGNKSIKNWIISRSP